MNETLGRGYARIEAIRAARGEPLSSMPDPGAPPPDRYNSVYLTLFVAGAAFLLPFNSFIMAVDYFQMHYPNTTIMFDMSTVYIASACVAVCLNNLLLDLFTYNTRITFGAAGFWVSLDRIVTKYGFRQPQRSTFMFFVFSILILLGHSMLHHVMMRHPLVQHYLRLTNESRHRRRIQLHLNPNEDATLAFNYGVGEIETNAFSFANPVYSPTAGAPVPAEGAVEPFGDGVTSETSSALRTPRPSYKVEDVVFEAPERPTSWRAFKRGVLARWAVARAIYPYMVSIGLVYFTTLSLYPGIASEVPSCRLGTWMPIILMSSFNLFDFIGKIAAAWPYEWSRSQLLMASGLRLLLVPLMLLCAAPRHSPHIVGDVYPILFSVALGFSNGLFGSVPMILAPSRVGREHREIAGNMMTLSYNGGLLSGSLVSYLLLGMLGPPAGAPCRVYPTPPLPTLPPATPPNVTFAVTISH
ncbi:hypothetical protein HF086_016244 [Spodoptera exigua]|uniref:Equilibrative nucleoside transporter 4 n=1 Tax=Spodoptera exigua TaxID=7107 RepID=A0A922MJK9_SPOEX|nr:hypothetical protein HF086_016244 [Spodoptera exigua]